MMLPKKSAEIDWPGFWANLLQGVGAGLLHHDGSRIAEAALFGLGAFDAAQERRDRRKSQAGTSGAGDRKRWPRGVPWPELSAAERAAYLQLSPEGQVAFDAEMAELAAQDDPAYRDVPPGAGSASALRQRAPASANPFDDWAFEALLPFGPDGQLRLPVFRR